MTTAKLSALSYRAARALLRRARRDFSRGDFDAALDNLRAADRQRAIARGLRCARSYERKAA